MPPRTFAVLVAFSALGGLLAPSRARADEAAAARPIFVVTVDARATELDAARLRTDIGGELGAIALPPGDPRAPRARGTIAVSIDRGAHVLVVSYRERGAPITRAVDLPPDAAATARAAVLLAGNLARDEAGELAAELRRTSTAHEEATAPSTAPTPAQADATEEPEDPAEAAARRDLERLKQTLSRYAAHHRTALGVVGWTTAGVAVAAEGAALYLSLQRNNRGAVTTGELPTALQATAPALEALGLWAAVTPSYLTAVERYYADDVATGRPPSLVLDDVEARWRRAAHQETSLRRLAGGLFAVAGVGGAVISTVLATLASQGVPNHQAVLDESAFAVTGGIELGLGLLLFFEDGPAETALRAYERSCGREDAARGVKDVGLRVLPAPGGGGIVGLGGRF